MNHLPLLSIDIFVRQSTVWEMLGLLSQQSLVPVSGIPSPYWLLIILNDLRLLLVICNSGSAVPSLLRLGTDRSTKLVTC